MRTRPAENIKILMYGFDYLTSSEQNCDRSVSIIKYNPETGEYETLIHTLYESEARWLGVALCKAADSLDKQRKEDYAKLCTKE